MLLFTLLLIGGFMKNYQYDIFGNLVPVDEIVKREQLAKKDKLKKR